MIGEGALTIRVDVSDGRVREVQVTSTRPVNAARALVGRATTEALELVPLLFPVCGMAQRVACERAIAAAEGRVDPDDDAGTVLALAEAAASHLFQIAIAWRDAAGGPRDTDVVREARGFVAELSRVLGAEPAAARALVEPLAARAEAFLTAEAPLLDLVIREGRAEFPSAERGGLVERLQRRRSEAREHLGALRAAAGRLRERPPRPPEASGRPPGTGEGVGEVVTARGPLVHSVWIDGGRIAALRVDAPTDRMSRPDGPLRRALVGAVATPTLARDVGWLALALDPCVPFEVEIRDA